MSKKVERKVVDVDTLASSAKKALAVWIDKYRAAKTAETLAQQTKAEASAAITEVMKTAKVWTTKARVDAWGTSVMRMDGVKKTLSASKLLEAGVDPAIIAKCWDESQYSYVLIGKEKV